MNRSVHVAVGVGGAVVVGAIRSADQDPWKRIVEGVGHSLGGYVGARAPDVLEPATSPCHRDVGHSAAVGAALVAGAWKGVPVWEGWFRAKADELAAARVEGDASSMKRIAFAILEGLCRMLAGFALGFAVGYGSHLALDMMTPEGIPLLARAIG